MAYLRYIYGHSLVYYKKRSHLCRIVILIIKINVMKFKPSIAFEDFAGSAGSVCASKNRGGKYLKTRINPLNPKTAYQTAVRASMSKFSKGFAKLTESQRAVWNEAAKLIPTVNSLGVHSVLSGFNYYLQLNLNLQVIGGTQVAAPPTAPVVFPLVSITGLREGGNDSFVDVEALTVAATQTVVIDSTPPFSLGRSSFPSKLRQVLTSVGAAAPTEDFNIGYALIVRFGSSFAIDEKRQISMYIIDNATGVASARTTFVGLVK